MINPSEKSQDSIAAPYAGSAARRRRGQAGYILFEATVAMMLLGVAIYGIHGAIRQAILTRGQAQDYTQARFLIEKVIADLEMQPLLRAGSGSGHFKGDMSRFAWQYSVRKIKIPKPEGANSINIGAIVNGKPTQGFEYAVEHLVHIRATVSWERAGHPFSETFETLFNHQKLWEPEEREL